MDNKGIIFKNIDLTGISKREQFDKYIEEEREFRCAYVDYKFTKSEEHKNHLIEEYFDLVQSALGLLEKQGITADEVMKDYPKHLEKLKSRPRKKQCKKCLKKSECWLYSDEMWQGEQEAEMCKKYLEMED